MPLQLLLRTFALAISKCTMAAVCLTTLAACTSGAMPTASAESSVFQAYNSSGVLDVPPYTRTIFSSTNF